jgi:hypothetical protein
MRRLPFRRKRTTPGKVRQQRFLSGQTPNAPKGRHLPCRGATSRSPEITCARSQSSGAEAGKRIHLGDVSTMKLSSQLLGLFMR